MTQTGLVFLIALGFSIVILTFLYMRKSDYFFPVLLLLIGIFLFAVNIVDVVSNFSTSPLGYSAQLVPALVFLVIGLLTGLGAYLKAKRNKQDG